MLQFSNADLSTSRDEEFSEAPTASPIDMVPVAIGILHRQWRIFAMSLFVTTVLALGYFLKSTPNYIAVATIVIDTGKFQLFGQQAGSLGEATIDGAAALENQLEIIKSEKIAFKVINDLNLVDTLVPQTRWLGAWRKPSDFERKQYALAAFEKRLTVERRGMALMINVSFASPSAELSAQIANTVADTFVSDHMEGKYEATRMGSAWLERRIADLRVQSEADQRAVVEFREKNNIVDAGKGHEQQLAEVNNQFGVARVQTSEAQARLERITAIARAANDEATISACLTGTFTSDNLAKLRVQYLELSGRATEFEQKYGREHLSVVNLRSQLEQVRRAILDEFLRLLHSYESDYNLAVTREKNLDGELAKLIAQSETTSRASVRLRELENAAELSTALYENFRKRYMESLEQQSFPVPEARVLIRALPPLRPEYKSLLKIIAAIFGAGVSLGAGIGLFRELMDRTYRTVSQVERGLQVNCLAMVPHVENRQHQAATPKAGIILEQRVFEIPQGPVSYLVSSPLSRYAESLRSVKLAVDMNSGQKSTKILGVTSALPGEGKSTIAASLAFTIGRSGAKVILLDCDLRNPSLTKAFVSGAARGFAEVVCGDIPLEDALWTDRAGIVSFLPVVFNPRFFSTEVMASRATKMLFESLRDNYDYVIVDLPPLVPIVDARATTPLIDASIFVIRWGDTKINVVEHVLGREAGIRENLLGVVLNNVDMKLLKSYDLKNSSIYQNANYFRYGQVD